MSVRTRSHRHRFLARSADGFYAGLQNADGFDAAWYRSTYLSAEQSAPDPLTHYLHIGWQSGYRPNRVFDPTWYLARYPDIVTARIEPYSHYSSIGWHENRDPAPLLSTDWYRKQYCARRRARVDPLTHYLTGGWQNHHWPHPLFDALWYATEYADWIPPDTSPLEHYLTTGAKLGFETSPYFDSRWYRRRIAHDSRNECSPVEHYIEAGATPTGAPNRLFDDAWYTARYLDDKRSVMTALGHFAHIGRFLHHKPSAEFDPLDYAVSSRNAVRPEDAMGHALASGTRTWHAPADVTAGIPRVINLGSLPSSALPVRLVIIACHDARNICGHSTRHLARSFKALGFTVALSYDSVISDLCDATENPNADFDMLIARDHDGYDFYSWRLALEQCERLIALNEHDSNPSIEEIILLNDSVIGPIFAFGDALAAWRALPFEVSGLVESAAPRPHIQSWATRFSGRAADFSTLLDYYGQAQSHASKHELIRDFEIPLATYFRNRGLTVGSLISPISVQSADDNPTAYGWREVIESGVPFIKRSVFAGGTETSPAYTSNLAFLNAIPQTSRHQNMECLVRDALAQL